MAKEINRIVRQIRPTPIREIMQLAAKTPGCIGLTIGEPDFDTPGAICEAASQALREGLTHYPPFNGRRDLIEALSAFEARQHGLHYRPEEIIVTTGATEGLYVACHCLLNPGDEVLVPLPGFGLYENIIRLCGGVMVGIDTAPFDFQLSEDLLLAALTDRSKALIITSPNNPTGRMLDAQSVETVVRFARRHNLYLICDEVYRDLVYTEGTPSFVSDFEEIRDLLVIVQSFSKPWAMTGWRLGYLMADQHLSPSLALVHQTVVTSAASFSQVAAITALETDLTEMKTAYRRRRDVVVSRLREMGFALSEPEGAFYVFPRVKDVSALSGTAFCHRLIEKEGLALVPGSAFGNDDYVRLSYCYSEEVLREGLDRLERFLKS